MNEYARAEDRLADLLVNMPIISDETGRRAISERLRSWRIEVDTTPGTSKAIYCQQLLSSILRQRMALGCLGDIIRKLESGSARGRQFADEVRALLPSDIFLLEERIDFIADIGRFVPPGKLHDYYVRAVGHGCPEEIISAKQLIGMLEDLPNDPDDKKCNPLVRLTEAIAGTAPDDSTRDQAWEWSDRVARNIDEIASQQPCSIERLKLADYRQSARHRTEEAVAADDGETKPSVYSEDRPSLMIVLDNHGPERKYYKLAISLYINAAHQKKQYTDDAPITLETARSKVIEVLSAVIRELRQPKRVTEIDLEFILPRDLLHYPVEEWVAETSSIPLGVLFIVVVRDLNRLRNPLLWPQWQRKWQTFDSVTSSPSATLSCWITCMDPPCQPGQGARKMLPAQLVSLGLTFPPPPRAQRFELSEALEAGTPIIVYPRQSCEHSKDTPANGTCPGDRFRRIICERLSTVTLRELPELIRQIRADPEPAEDEPLRAALLWDDPDRLPDAKDFRLDVPEHEEDYE